ncbi:MAG: recombinase family protein [Clostridia bacterium]|nr:recombinase family protein [Clostridia bacterium]
MNKNITVIPATRNIHARTPKTEAPYKRRVAAYARVSTDSEEQLTSYEAQVHYYTNYILSNRDWKFVKVYTDEGISATNTKKREGFNTMIEDALSGEIDLIVTKSVSRFARNTVDSLTTVRKLKEKGVEVYFEKENIYTLDSKGELLITIMSSLAQEESRSISENVTWGQRKRFADGKVSLPYKQFLGYKKGENGLPEIVPDQAELVRRIYRMFMQGNAPSSIARKLTEEEIPTPGGKTKWQSSTVKSILQNEKYRGDARLQKSFTVDFLQKKTKINEGEVPQYYVENSHPAIIPPQEWDMVQAEIKRRKETGHRFSSSSIFSSSIFCGDCGSPYGSKVWHSNSKYKRIVWQCNNKFNGTCKCTTPHFYEEELKELFLHALGKITTFKESILEDCRLMQQTLSDCTELDTEQKRLTEELETTEILIRKSINENTRRSQTRNDRQQLMEKYETLKSQLVALETERQRKADQTSAVNSFIRTLQKQQTPFTEFDDDLWHTLIERVTVNDDESVLFKFKGGMEIATQK